MIKKIFIFFLIIFSVFSLKAETEEAEESSSVMPKYGNQKDKIAPTRVLSSIAKKADIRTKEIIRELETKSR